MNNVLKNKQFAIVGCGTAGLTTAILLRRLGCKVTIFDQFTTPRASGAGILLQPTGLWVLNQLDLARPILASGAIIQELIGQNSAQSTVLQLNYTDYLSKAFAVGAHRGNLFQILLGKAQESGVVIRCAHKATRIVDTGNKREIHFAAQAPQQADCLVIADGSFSRTRHCIKKMSRSKKDYPWGALWAILDDKEHTFSGQLRQRYRSAATMIGVLPSGINPVTAQPCVSFFWSLPVKDFPLWQAGPLNEWKQQVLACWPELSGLLDQVHTKDQLTFARYTDVRYRSWHTKNSVIIGDAAHAMSPQLGQGVNLALMDAWRLVECIQKASDIPTALAHYSVSRKKQLDFYQNACALITPFYQSHSKTLGWVRDLVTPLSCHIEPFKSINLSALSGNARGLLAKGELDGQELKELFATIQ